MALASRIDGGGAARPGRHGRALVVGSALVAAGTIATKVAGMGKEMATALRLGVGPELDAFLLALVVPSTLVALVAGPLSSAFVPAFVAARHHEGDEGGARLLDGALLAGIALASCVTLLVASCATPLLRALGGAADVQRLVVARDLLVLLLPMVVIQVPVALWSGVLNANGRFALPAVAPAAMPLCAAGAVLLAAPGSAARALAIGLASGCALQMLLLAPAVRGLGWLRLPRWPRSTERLRRLAAQLLPLAVGALVLSGVPIVDQAFAARLPAGSLATLAYAEKLAAFFNGAVAMSLATAILPLLAQEIAAERWHAASRLLRRSALVVAAVSVPLAIGLALGSRALASLLFERGAFGADDVLLVGGVQQLYVLQIPFFAVGMLLSRFLAAAHRTDLLLVGNVCLLIANVVLDALLVRWLGVGGIALATSLVYALAALLLFVMCRHVQRSAATAGNESSWWRR
jgi:putative peptidoglycan lipid II flippase